MPWFVQRLMSERVWAFPKEKEKVYLTFDDGPIPEVTPWVLESLSKYNAKATFFCIGDNINKHPKVLQKVIENGHAIGNHTFHHLNSSKTKSKPYIENVALFEKQLEATASKLKLPLTTHHAIYSHYFRPPYGRLNSIKAKKLQQQGYTIVMWDILSGDFDNSISEEQCYQNVVKYLQPGSIVVFHDSLKAEKNLRYVLPKVLEFIQSKGWKCDSM